MNVNEFHQQLDFCTKIYKLPNESGVVAHYPQYIIRNKHIEKSHKIYQFDEKGILMSFIEPRKYQKTYEMPRYVFRPFVAADIILTSHIRNIDTSLFYFFNEELKEVKTKSIMQFLHFSLDVEEKKKEVSITEMFTDILYQVDCTARSRSLDVEEGYRLLSALIHDGETK